MYNLNKQKFQHLSKCVMLIKKYKNSKIKSCIFNPEIFSWRRIRLAPTLILIGFGIQIYAILLNPDKK